MSSTIWTPLAVSSEARAWAAPAWRIVEAQHVASTMKIVDDAAEQDVLELLLETSKPPQPSAVSTLDYLLATPFRYDPRRGGSRFRGATDPGVFYGAHRALVDAEVLLFILTKMGPSARTILSHVLESSARGFFILCIPLFV